MASQIYTRRRRALARPISSGDAHKLITADEALETLTQAAERFVNGVLKLKRMDADRQALQDAITRAQLVLSVGRIPSKVPAGSPTAP